MLYIKSALLRLFRLPPVRMGVGSPAVERMALWAPNMMRLRSRMTALVLCCLILLVLPLVQLCSHTNADFYMDYFSKYRPGQRAPGSAGHLQSQFASPCDGFPDTSDVLLMVKTRAAQLYSKMPVHFLTTLQCLRESDYLILSDKNQDISGHAVHDVLDRVSTNVRIKDKAFRFYEQQQECLVAQDECSDDLEAALQLEKYMVLNMAVRAWEMRPGRKWYIFAEDDTYILWPNLLHWLRRKANPKKVPFVGSVVMLDGYPFAHGGSGFVLAGETIEKLIRAVPNVTAQSDAVAKGTPYGNMVLAKALDQIGVTVRQAHPMFNGEKPSTIPYGRQHWCQPVFTMSGMQPEEISSAWEFETSRNETGIIQYKDIYRHFMAPRQKYFRKEWDNYADDVCYIGSDSSSQGRASAGAKSRQKAEKDKNIVEKNAHRSAAACSKVCEAEGLDIPEKEYTAFRTETERGRYVRDKHAGRAKGDAVFAVNRQCFQWKYQNGACCVGSTFRLGNPTEKLDKRNAMVSGWFVEGINDWIDGMGNCELDWKEPVIPK